MLKKIPRFSVFEDTAMDRAKKDILKTIEEQDLYFPLANSTILITGATGMIGSALVKNILSANEKYELGINVVGQIRNYEKAREIFGKQFNLLSFVSNSQIDCDYIIHTISPTTSKFFIENPVETIKSSVESAMEILEVAKINRAKMVYLSSMEQYGVPYVPGTKMTEDKIGIIDHLNIRSSYSESKRLCECLCVSYSKEYDVDVKVARLAQTFGAGMPLTDNRMPIQFARAVAENKDIILHTEGKSISNFVYLTDAVTGILTILGRGKKGEAYNICNDAETRSVREIAELVAEKVAKGKIKVLVEKKENMGYAPDVEMYLVSDKLRELGWKPTTDMETAYRRLVSYLFDQKQV